MRLVITLNIYGDRKLGLKLAVCLLVKSIKLYNYFTSNQCCYVKDVSCYAPKFESGNCVFLIRIILHACMDVIRSGFLAMKTVTILK